MTTKSAFSIVGLAHKVCLTGEEVGYTPELFNELAEQPGLFRKFLQVQLGYAEIKPIEHVVDGDADPFLPSGWQGWETHVKSGPMKLERRGLHLYMNGKKIVLFTSEKQLEGKWVRGHELREELSGKKVLNTNVLDYLLANPELIPESWKETTNGNTTYIFFWGTIYRHSGDRLCVRCLSWDVGQWYWSFGWLDGDFCDRHPAALRAS